MIVIAFHSAYFSLIMYQLHINDLSKVAMTYQKFVCIIKSLILSLF